MSRSVDARRVVSREQVVHGGCRYFLRHGSIDMPALASSLAVSRATLYRVVHRRDAVLGDVLWRLGERLLTRARRRRGRTGVEGVLEVTRSFSAELRNAAPFTAFLRAEPETATRVLFHTPEGVHRRMVAAQRAVLLENRTPTWRPTELDDLAFLYVRIVESALYAELLNGRRLDPATAERAARALLTDAP
ncbi:QsdR family transcriptional regulator [Saccharomonospora halophila]|uniref:QsdR family transcriptional regulator n=1 Tax=Saccharomonospora halophila TaxID=129922 RepID=UPI000368FC38|nr:QsdR family transcriptional regulator [Saccharomonospora halophila]